MTSARKAELPVIEDNEVLEGRYLEVDDYTIGFESYRLAAALARAWAYGGDGARAARFAAESQRLAEGTGDPQGVADSLDAALLGSWGPDLRDRRAALAAELADVAAHRTETETQLTACCWRLTTAWEALDTVAIQRQLRALDVLAQETGSARVEFFAKSRRAMHALKLGDVESAALLLEQVEAVGEQAGEPDASAVRHALRSELAVRRGDVAAIRDEAGLFEAYAMAEGIRSVFAQSAVLSLAAGDTGAARAIIDRIAGDRLVEIPADVDFLLTASCLLEVAIGLRLVDLATVLVDRLAPYADHVVLNAGAVTFHGVVADFLVRAQRMLLRDPDADWRQTAERAYRRLGATWWLRRSPQGATAEPRSVRREPVAPAPAQVRPVGRRTGRGDGVTAGPAGAAPSAPAGRQPGYAGAGPGAVRLRIGARRRDRA